jgi:acyl carrier protein
MKTNLERLQMIMLDRGQIEVDSLVPEANLTIDMDLDSLDIVELTLDVEKEFDIRISDREMEEWVTIQDVLNSINNQKI